MSARQAASRRLAAALLAALAGCTTIGPDSIPRDRFDYSDALAQSWKRQTLLNIVKLRYLDVPVFLDVGQVVSGYTLEQAVQAGIAADLAPDGNVLSVGSGLRYTDRPTITYTPLTGDRFLRGLVTPLPARSVMLMLQAGYPADFTLGWSLGVLSGLKNRTSAAGQAQPAEPGFVRALELLRDIQSAGFVSLAVRPGAAGGEDSVLVFHREGRPPELVQKSDQLRELLGLTGETSEFRLVTSPGRSGPGELALQPRSLLQVMSGMAAGVDVPAAHVADGRATPAPPAAEFEASVRVRSSPVEPDDAFVAVPYRGHWFWIEDTDWRSKRAFALVMFLFTLAEGAGTQPAPVLTIPTS
jgi:hypothetical protein